MNPESIIISILIVNIFVVLYATKIIANSTGYKVGFYRESLKNEHVKNISLDKKCRELHEKNREMERFVEEVKKEVVTLQLGINEMLAESIVMKEKIELNESSDNFDELEKVLIEKSKEVVELYKKAILN